MADAIKCPVTVRGDAWVDIVSATGRVLATGVGRDVADEIARKLNAHEAMAAFILAHEKLRDWCEGRGRRVVSREDVTPDGLTFGEHYDRLETLQAAALAVAKGGQS